MADTLLDIVDENDQVIGQAMRSEVHAKGLLHRVVHVWFITPQKKVVLQKRSMSKDIDPGLLTNAVSGHVESGTNFEDTALLEVEEETGLNVKKGDLQFLAVRTRNYFDKVTNLYDNEKQRIYGMVFKGDLEDLTVESVDGEGFVMVDWDDLCNPSEGLIASCLPDLIDPEFMMIKDALEALVEKNG